MFGLDLYLVETKPSSQTNGALTSTHLFKHLPPPPQFATQTHTHLLHNTPVPSAPVRLVKKRFFCVQVPDKGGHYYTVRARCPAPTVFYFRSLAAG